MRKIQKNCRVSGKCSHIVGLTKCIQQFKVLGLKDVPTEQSCTSLPQQWNIPRGNKIQPVSINEVLVVKAKETHKKVPVLPKEIKSRYMNYLINCKFY